MSSSHASNRLTQRFEEARKKLGLSEENFYKQAYKESDQSWFGVGMNAYAAFCLSKKKKNHDFERPVVALIDRTLPPPAQPHVRNSRRRHPAAPSRRWDVQPAYGK